MIRGSDGGAPGTVELTAKPADMAARAPTRGFMSSSTDTFEMVSSVSSRALKRFCDSCPRSMNPDDDAFLLGTVDGLEESFALDASDASSLAMDKEQTP